MLGGCTSCPGAGGLKTALGETTLLRLQATDTIKFKRWISKNRATLETVVLPSEEFVGYLTNQLLSLKEHHFVAKRQSSFLRHLKEELPEDEAIFLMDFVENYNFLVQDSPQSFYWSESQATKANENFGGLRAKPTRASGTSQRRTED